MCKSRRLTLDVYQRNWRHSARFMRAGCRGCRTERLFEDMFTTYGKILSSLLYRLLASMYRSMVNLDLLSAVLPVHEGDVCDSFPWNEGAGQGGGGLRLGLTWLLTPVLGT